MTTNTNPAATFTEADVLASYQAAIALACGDVRMGRPRWLRELIAMAPTRVHEYPAYAAGYRAAARKGRNQLHRLGY